MRLTGPLCVPGRALVRPGTHLELSWLSEPHRPVEKIGGIPRLAAGACPLSRENWAALAPEVIRWQLEEDPRGPKLGGLTELRAAVEPVAAAVAARRATEEQRSRLLELAASIRATGERGSVASSLADDIAFHCLILTASQNDAFAALTGVSAEVLTGRARLGGDVDIPKTEALDLHERVARCIATGDAPSAPRRRCARSSPRSEASSSTAVYVATSRHEPSGTAWAAEGPGPRGPLRAPRTAAIRGGSHLPSRRPTA